MKKILYEKESLTNEIISKGFGKRDFSNILDFWKKIRENKSKFYLNQKIVSLINDIETKISNIGTNIQINEKEKPKPRATAPNINVNKININIDDKNIKNRNIDNNTHSIINNENNEENIIPENNLENNSFHFVEKKLGENIIEMDKNNIKIINFLEIDLFLLMIAEGKNIYDDVDMENKLLNGFCMQHTAFIKTDILINKIISCFNYFYSRYINQDNENKNNKASAGLRMKYSKNKQNKEDNKNIFKENIKKIPYNIINLLILFVEIQDKYCRETLNSGLIEKIQSFLSTILVIHEINDKYEKEILSSYNILKEIKNSEILKRTISRHNKIPFENLLPNKISLNDKIRDPNNPNSFFDILKFDSKEIAVELTYISFKLFSKIKPKEFLKGVFTKKNKKELSPNITELSNRFNKLSFWAIEEILMYDHSKTRGTIIEKFIDIINELILLNNFFDSMSLSSGLGQVILNNLKKTWNHVSKKSMELYKKNKQILNFQDNYKIIREKIDNCITKNQPYIPFLGPYSKTICYLEEYGPYTKDNSLINASKIVLVQQVLDQLFRFKLNSYNKYQTAKNELFIFQCLDPASEEELEMLASHLEPKFVLYDKKQNEKRASNTEKHFKVNYENNPDLVK